ncbi:MAG: hypothetical protein COB02_01730 [Candidatus Cloacimonadota bacterium]|nr:MAG: hypothetical protein COB02_01730 [Candidatus Cloacimonadota bacterium]
MKEIFNENGAISIEDWKENLGVCFELTQLNYLAVISYSNGTIKNILDFNQNYECTCLNNDYISSFFKSQETHFLQKEDLKSIKCDTSIELLVSLPIFSTNSHSYFLFGIHNNKKINHKNSLILRSFQSQVSCLQREYHHFRKKDSKDSFHEMLLKSSFKELGLIRKALDSSTIVAITNSKGKITYANHQLCQISGFTLNELIGQDHKILNSSYHPKSFFKNLWTTIKSGSIWKGLVKNKTKNGSFYWVNTTIVPFLDQNKKVTQYVAIRHDVTQKIELSTKLEKEKEKLKEALIELKEANEHLDRTSRFADMGTLAAEISHDFNNTLSVITMGIEVCLINALPQEVLETLIKMKSTALNASSLTKKLMSLGKKLKTQAQATILIETINDALQLLKPVFQSLGITMTIDVPVNFPIVLLNQNSISDLIRNLTMNSLHSIQEAISLNQIPKSGHKFTIQGQLLNNQIILILTDTGRGIPKKIQSKIYDPFFTTKERSEQKGTGLGMSMVFSTIQAHSGTIQLESTHENDLISSHQSTEFTGTKFTISFPAIFPQAENKKLQDLLPKAVNNPNELIFVVDDEKHFLRFIKTMIKSFGYTNVKYFNNGKELLTKYNSLIQQKETLPKLIITDIQMPEMNGFDLVQSIFNKRSPSIIIMTGKSNEDNLNRFKDIGVKNFLSKPFSVSQLREMIDLSLNN